MQDAISKSSKSQSKNGKPRAPRVSSEILDTQPPADVKAEQQLLASVMLDSARLADVSGMLRAESFYDPRHGILWGHLENIPSEVATDISLLIRWLSQAADLSACGGIEYITEIANSEYTAANAKHYAQIVADAATNRHFRALFEGGLQLTGNSTITPADLHSYVTESIKNLPAAGDPPSFAKMIDSASLAAWDVQPEFLVNNILVKGQPAIFGGRSKTLKTGLAIDLAISLGSGSPFLGQFSAKQYNVAVWSGESGIPAIRNTALRVAAARGVSLPDCSILWAFDLPKLSRDIDLDEIRRIIEARKIDVAIFDPLYLCLLGGNEAQGAGNVYFMGSKLVGLSQLAQQSGVTPIVLHHFKKTQSDENEPCTLEDLSQAGAAEWCRQWLLLARAEPYQHDGVHRLFMRSGGSAGFGGLYNVTVDEGMIDGTDFANGRKWETSVTPAGDFRGEMKRQQEQRKAERLEALEGEHRQRLLNVLIAHPEGETSRTLREESGLNTGNFGKAIASLLQEGRAVACEVNKSRGKYDGYRPKV